MKATSRKEKKGKKEVTCPPTAQEIKKWKNKKQKTKKRHPEKKRKKRKKRKRKVKWTRHLHFCLLNSHIFSIKFSLNFGEKTFWWVQRENTWISPFIFLLSHSTERTQKSFPSHFLRNFPSFLFHLQTNMP